MLTSSRTRTILQIDVRPALGGFNEEGMKKQGRTEEIKTETEQHPMWKVGARTVGRRCNDVRVEEIRRRNDRLVRMWPKIGM